MIAHVQDLLLTSFLAAGSEGATCGCAGRHKYGLSNIVVPDRVSLSTSWPGFKLGWRPHCPNRSFPFLDPCTCHWSRKVHSVGKAAHTERARIDPPVPPPAPCPRALFHSRPRLFRGKAPVRIPGFPLFHSLITLLVPVCQHQRSARASRSPMPCHMWCFRDTRLH